MKRKTLKSHGPWGIGCQHGFTLPELLVAGIIAALLAAGTAQVMIGQLLEGRRLEATQRVRENLSRLNYLIQIEASESDEIELGQTAPECTASGTQGFTMYVPKPAGIYASDENRSGIEYFNRNGNIERCGPRVFRNGVLEHAVGSDGALHATGVVLRNAQLVLDPAGCTQSTSSRQVVYQVNFPGSNFGEESGACVVAHAKSVFVCNPENPSNPGLIGDCD
ncbi:prepilin-type N-terminal cleavage/methylation domain-containing protein [Cyanobium sp. ATX 6A2]|uniref:prepilin-type N-terminal cleavage/methylation domain-containing protein n=1 Tax=Cyanobium sp. ATX 6A2 TaxID=2823700 RepID=UPI0020CF819F|nr:prepilin-type N-terminal cleavage/methylation domain-containing protein [Cyanobium sp. ATX 6A2]MCP9886733.1 prepilin-type N-terminal cleavage/methylation domain-containing protein [Cyanobium sp. ATX 6A2]